MRYAPVGLDGVLEDPGATLLAGHSHVRALYNAWVERTRFPNVPERVITVTQWGTPRSSEYWDRAVSECAGRVVAVLWEGNQHNAGFLMEANPALRMVPLPPHLLGQTEASTSPSVQYIAFEAAVASFSGYLEELGHLIERMVKARIVLVIGTPPPKSDKLVRRGLAKESSLIETIEAQGMEIASVPLTPLPTRLALWQALQEAMAGVVTEKGATFVSVPFEAHDEQGALRECFCAPDATHANPAYGALMWNAIRAQLGHKSSSAAVQNGAGAS